MRTRLSGHDQILVGVTLFSMFFGAGNLIFPPYLGAQAGTAAWVAMIGMAISAVGLPVLGVVAVAQAGGLQPLAERVHPKFAQVFTLLIYLSIGPCLAIPRTATTSFEMAVTPFLGETSLWVRAGYSLVFFAAALAVALKPDRLSDKLGKITGPALLTLIFVLVAGCLVKSPGGYGPATVGFVEVPVIQGFLDGYQTMDTIAALNFGIIIALNIRARGVTKDRQVVRATIRAGWIAGGVLLVVYAALTHVGAVSGGAFPGSKNGAQVLTRLVSWMFGPAGNLLLGAVFVIACFNTCTGLISCCSEYFSSRFFYLNYRTWAVVFAGASFLISIAGLNAILSISVPVLGAIYPVAIVLILLGLTHRWVGKLRLTYPLTVLFTGAASVAGALGVKLPIPLAEMGLGWILPALIGFALGAVLSPLRSERS